MHEDKIGIVEVIEGMAKRLEKAKALTSGGKVRKIEGSESWVVETEDGGNLYLIQNDSYTCPDFQQRKELHKGWCKHRLAVALASQNQTGKEKR